MKWLRVGNEVKPSEWSSVCSILSHDGQHTKYLKREAFSARLIQCEKESYLSDTMHPPLKEWGYKVGGAVIEVLNTVFGHSPIIYTLAPSSKSSDIFIVRLQKEADVLYIGYPVNNQLWVRV